MTVEMHEISCTNCGVVFMITKSHKEQLRSSHKGFYCPNGHPLYYEGKTDAQKLAQTERRLGVSRDQRERLRRSNSALRGVITKMRKGKK